MTRFFSHFHLCFGAFARFYRRPKQKECKKYFFFSFLAFLHLHSFDCVDGFARRTRWSEKKCLWPNATNRIDIKWIAIAINNVALIPNAVDYSNMRCICLTIVKIQCQKKSTRAKMSTECKLNNFLHVFTFYKNLVELLSIVCLLLKAFTMLLHDLLTDLARLNWIFVLNFIVSSRIRFDKEKRMKLGKKWQWRKWQKKSEWEK